MVKTKNILHNFLSSNSASKMLLTICCLKLQVSSVGVTGARASVSDKVQGLLQEIKEVCLFPFLCKTFVYLILVSTPVVCHRILITFENLNSLFLLFCPLSTSSPFSQLQELATDQLRLIQQSTIELDESRHLCSISSANLFILFYFFIFRQQLSLWQLVLAYQNLSR